MHKYKSASLIGKAPIGNIEPPFLSTVDLTNHFPEHDFYVWRNKRKNTLVGGRTRVSTLQPFVLQQHNSTNDN